jgi:hypothetical protein
MVHLFFLATKFADTLGAGVFARHPFHQVKTMGGMSSFDLAVLFDLYCIVLCLELVK